MARVPYVSREDLPAEKQSVYDRIAETRGGIDGHGMPNSFRLLLNSPDAAEAVGQLGEHVRLRSTLHPASARLLFLAWRARWTAIMCGRTMSLSQGRWACVRRS